MGVPGANWDTISSTMNGYSSSYCVRAVLGNSCPRLATALLPFLVLSLTGLSADGHAAESTYKVRRNDTKVSVQLERIPCNPWQGYKNVGFTAWGIWSFASSTADFDCGPGKRVNYFSISIVSTRPFGEVIMRTKGRHIRNVDRYEYFEDSLVAGRLLNEIIAFTGVDGKRVVVRMPIASWPTQYVAYRMLDEKVELSYSISRQPEGDSDFFERDHKILALVKSVVAIQHETQAYTSTR